MMIYLDQIALVGNILLIFMVNIWIVIIWIMMVNNNLVGGFSPYPSEKYELVRTSWDDDIPNWMEK